MDEKLVYSAVAHLSPKGELNCKKLLNSILFCSDSVDVVLELDYTIRHVQHKPYYPKRRSNMSSLYSCKMREWD